jgi:small-conductance mechanosensitive channel
MHTRLCLCPAFAVPGITTLRLSSYARTSSVSAFSNGCRRPLPLRHDRSTSPTKPTGAVSFVGATPSPARAHSSLAISRLLAVVAKKPPPPPPPQGFLPRVAAHAAVLGKFLASLQLRRGDVVITLACFCFPGHVTRLFYAIYAFLLRRIDPAGKRVFVPQTYEQSVFAALEGSGTLRIGGGLSALNILLRLIFALGKLVGVSDPISMKGGTPMRFQTVATALFAGWMISNVKRSLLMRGDVGGLRSPRQRFVIDRVSDAVIVVLAALACIESSGLPLQSVAAAGGIGGLAIGLAGKEVAENLIGGVAVLATSPFVPGDTVTTADTKGKVMDVGFYMTRLQDFDGTTVSVPNSRWTNAVVTNISRARRRRFMAVYCVRYACHVCVCSPRSTAGYLFNRSFLPFVV